MGELDRVACVHIVGMLIDICGMLAPLFSQLRVDFVLPLFSLAVTVGNASFFVVETDHFHLVPFDTK